MADADEKLQQAEQMINLAEGYMSDAEFREEHETRQIRYLQAISSSLVALSLQNSVIIELLRREEEL